MRQRLLYTIAWRDLRWPFIASVIFVLAFAASVAVAFKLAESAAAQGVQEPEWVVLSAGPHAYARFLDWIWFRVPGASFVIAAATVFIASAVPVRKKAPDTPFLLLLPFSRRQIFLGRFAVLGALVAVLCLLTSAVFVVVGLTVFGETYPVSRAILTTLLATLGSLAWAGVTVALASYVNRILAVGLMITAIYMAPVDHFRLTLPPRPQIKPASSLNAWAVTDPALWSSSIPWLPLALTLLLASLGVFIAVHRFSTTDN